MDIVLPFLHIPGQKKDENIDAEQTTALNEALSKESRTALTMSATLTKNPRTAYVVNGTMELSTAGFMINTLLGMRYQIMTTIQDSYYATHVTKRMDFTSYDGTYLYAEEGVFLHYVKTTRQDVSAMSYGVVIDFDFGVFTAYHSGPVTPATTGFVKFAFPVSKFPIADMALVRSLHGYYPIRVVPETMRIDVRYSKEGRVSFNFGADIHPSVDRKELL